MKPINFDGANIILGKEQNEYLDLPAHKGEAPLFPITSCWELSDAEIKTIKKTKKIYLRVYTFNKPLQPQLLTVNKEEIV